MPFNMKCMVTFPSIFVTANCISIQALNSPVSLVAFILDSSLLFHLSRHCHFFLRVQASCFAERSMIWICLVVPHSCLRFTIFVEDYIRGVCFHCVTSGCHIVLNSVVCLRWCLLDLSIVKAPLPLCSFVIICRMIIWDWDPQPPFGSIHWDPCLSQ